MFSEGESREEGQNFHTVLTLSLTVLSTLFIMLP